MSDYSRDDVATRNSARHQLRSKLLSDANQAKHDLHPKTIASRWAGKQKQKLIGATGQAKQKVAKNAPLIGLAGVGVLLFAARKPISNWVNHLRNRKVQNEDDEA